MLNPTKYYLTISLLLILFGPISANKPNPNIAVLDFQGSNLSQNDSKVLTDKFRYILVKSNKYNVIERNQMNEVLREQGFQQTGCTTDECAVEIGQLLNVSLIVGGTVGQIGDTYLLTSRLIDIGTGKITQMSKVEITGTIEDLLRNGIDNLATKLMDADTKKNDGFDDNLNKIAEQSIRRLLIGQLNGELRELVNNLKPSEVSGDPFWIVKDIWKVEGKNEYVASVEFNIFEYRKKVVNRTYRYIAKQGLWNQTTSTYADK